MAASRSMLESLLARVRQRAAEPRGAAAPAVPAAPAPAVAREASAAQDPASVAVAKPAFAAPVAAPAPVAVAKPAFAAPVAAPAPVAAASAAEIISTPPSSGPVLETSPAIEEEVEEYDAELIEILDDDVASEVSESSREERPIELSASLPSVEVRRRVQSSRPPPSRPAVAAVAPVSPLPAAVPPPVAAAPAPLHGEVVARRPVSASAVVQSPAPRPEARSMSFVDLLDDSLNLGG